MKVLVVGIGSIGQEIAKRFKYGLNMKITGVKRDINNIEHLKDLVEDVITLSSIGEHIHKYDVIVNAMPAVPGGPVFTDEMFSKMKKKTVFINVGRGSVLDLSLIHI